MTRTLVVVFLVGLALFGAIAFIPLFVQSVMGGTATQAGQVLTPLFLGWVVMSIVGARLTVRMGYRVAAIGGSVLMTLGFVGLVDARRPLDPDDAAGQLHRARRGHGLADAVAAAGRAARRGPVAARPGHVAQSVFAQHRRRRRRRRDGRHHDARPDRRRAARRNRGTVRRERHGA